MRHRISRTVGWVGHLAVLLCCLVLAHGSWAHGSGDTGTTAPDTADLPAVTVRFAIHDGFDRLVLLLPDGRQAVSQQTGSTLSVDMPNAGSVEQVAVHGRRLRAFQGGIGHASLEVESGARVRVWRMENRVVIDVLDPPPASRPPRIPQTVGAQVGLRVPPDAPRIAGVPASPSRPAAAPRATASAPPRIVTPAPVAVAQLPVSVPALRVDPLSPADPSVVHAPAAEPLPANSSGAAVVLLARDKSLPDRSILLPFGQGVGAAAFARGGQAHVVFDTPRPMDLSALADDPVFGNVTEAMLPDGTHLRLHLPPAAQLRLLRREDGWVISVVEPPASVALSPLPGHVDHGVLTLDAKAAGRVVVLDDDVNGGRLLVGTQLASGEHVASPHLGAEFTLLPTWQGVVVQPASDRVMLRATRTGFELAAAGEPALSVAWSEQLAGNWPDGRIMTRLFDLPNLPPAHLSRRLAQALRDAAVTPRSARFGPRLAVAQATLALGMDAEAAAVLHVAVADDPSHSDDPKVAGLSAMAAWLSAVAGGSAIPGGNDDLSRLGGSDEAAVWRALLVPARPGSAYNAAALAASWPIILDYPPGLRHLMLRPAIAVLNAGGQDAAASALLAASSDPILDIPRAELLRRQGRTDEALALLDRVAQRSDRLVRAEALDQAVELRLATHRLDAAGAAKALDRQMYVWRGGDRELHVRERVAELRAQAGQWRPALTMLRETDRQFPQAHAELRAAEKAVVADLLQGGRAEALAAFDLATLAEEDADLLTPADVETSLAPVLADKLLALDLPGRAEPILRKLFDRAAAGSAKAEIGVRLAELLADRDAGSDALQVLDGTDDAGLSQELISRRALLRARLLQGAGKPEEALSALSGLHGLQAGDLAATIMEKQRDWRGAANVLTAAAHEPGFGTLADSAQRDMLLRIARDESEAGDMAALRRLHDAEQARFAAGQGAELFAVLTAEPVRGAGDLSRSARELSNMRALPAKLVTAQTF